MTSLRSACKMGLCLGVALLAFGLLLVSCVSFPSEAMFEAGSRSRLPTVSAANARQFMQWWSSWAPLSSMPQEERLRLLVEENSWKNSLVMWMFPEAARLAMPHIVQTWLRNWILSASVYTAAGLAWCYYSYFCFGDVFFPAGGIPGLKDVLGQIKVTNIALPVYSMLPTFGEWAAEKGYTMAYPRIDNVGLPAYLVYFVLYMMSVEFFVYWMHRGVHESKWAYRHLHHIHHKYNKEHTLSPFAGLAFHPIDGILQVVPYVWTLFYCPMHFLTHEILLFVTAVWTANIHDNIHGKVWPILGAKYHTIHHTMYNANYGHYLIFMDKWFGTLETPEDHDARMAKQQH